MQTHSVVAELFHAGGRTDMTIIVAFPSVAKAPKKIIMCLCSTD